MSTAQLGLGLFAAAGACLLAAAVLCAILRHRPVAWSAACSLGCVAGSALTIAAALVELVRGPDGRLTVLSPLPNQTLIIEVGGLGAFFWLLIAIPALAIGLTLFECLHHSPSNWLVGSLSPLLILGLLLLVVSGNALTLVVLWGTTGLLAATLVRCEQPDLAGWPELVSTQAAAACLLLALLVLAAGSHATSFAAFRALGPGEPLPQQSLVFLLTLTASLLQYRGLRLSTRSHPSGSVRTPQARTPHEPAPQLSPTTPPTGPIAILRDLAGLATAGFALTLVSWTFLSAGPLWWGALPLAIGTILAVRAAFQALIERDLDRFPAISGLAATSIMLLALGGALLLRALQPGPATTLGITAALLLTLNGTICRVLLGLAAPSGTIRPAHSTPPRHTRRLPWAAISWLTGALGLAALPPFGGFTGGWLLLHALLAAGGATQHRLAAVTALAALATLLLAWALLSTAALATFSRAFLGSATDRPAVPRSHPLRAIALGLLALATLSIGVLPTGVVRLLRPVTRGIPGAGSATGSDPGPFDPLQAVSASAAAALTPLALLAGVAGTSLLCWLLARIIAGRRPLRAVPAWTGGLHPRTAESFDAGANAELQLRRAGTRLSAALRPVRHALQRSRQHLPRNLEILTAPTHRRRRHRVRRVTRRLSNWIPLDTAQLHLAVVLGALLVVLALVR